MGTGAGEQAAAERSFDVFLAYNSADAAAVTAARIIDEALRQGGHKVWFAERETVGGEPNVDAMTNALRSSKCCFMLHGEKGLGRWQGGFERLVATQLRIATDQFRVVPIALPSSNVETLPLDLQVVDVVDLRGELGPSGITANGELSILAAAVGESVGKFIESRAAKSSSVTARRSLAMLIGVSRYTHVGLKDLHGPLNDVDELEGALADAGTPTGAAWSTTKHKDLDILPLQEALRSFFTDEAGPGDTALFYYSGHGLVDENDSYICATDTNPDNREWTTISAKQIAALLKNCAAAEKVVILDCCHAAKLVNTAYENLGEGVAVVVGSRGLADDAVVAEPSPFTRNLLGVLGDPNAFGEAGLTVGGLLAAMNARGESPWTNPSCARAILLAARPGTREAAAKEIAPTIAVRLSAGAVSDNRLQLIRQLAATLDGLLAVAPDEGALPTALVSDTIQLLASELRCLAHADDLSALDDSDGARVAPTYSVRFADVVSRSKLRDLPLEYLSFYSSSTEQGGAASIVRNPRIPVERVFAVPRTKQGGLAIPQRVVLFNSLDRAGPEQGRVLASRTADQLKEIGLAPDLPPLPTWPAFCGYPDDADVIVLQAPLKLVGGEVMVLFADKASGETRDVLWSYVKDQLKDRRGLTWLFIETVANGSRSESAFAVRRLAQELAENLARPVVGICHSRAYPSCLEDNPNGVSFIAHLLRQLKAEQPLERAAQAARRRAVGSLAVNDPAVVGLPIVMRPVQEEPEEPSRPVARRDAAQ